MDQAKILDIPASYDQLLRKSEEIGFTMPSDTYIGTLLKTLIASKPNGNFLELGTGIGLSLSWMIDGMCEDSALTTVDNDPNLTVIAESFFGADTRVDIVCQDGGNWIQNYSGKAFDLVFADAWPGKYDYLETILDTIVVSGFYVIDDMKVQSNWPDGHEDHVNRLISELEAREDFVITKMDWSTGVIVAVKTK
ncbi:class I SAM-dependent methyltransferase [uncultured Croceitalea sp.]|uniref:O-methyltransferase n=1 Tax=uncultured Croceitalea sp. TaxID=1798908 RepID=UPI0033058FE7